MELFKAEKVGETEGNSKKKCRACDQTVELVLTMFITHSGDLIRIYQCQCGERIWDK